MFNPVEGARHAFHGIEERTRGPVRDYVGSIASRTFGLDAPRLLTSALERDHWIIRRVAQLEAVVGQYFFPATADSILIDVIGAKERRNPHNSAYLKAAQIMGSFTLDYATFAISVANHSPLEILAWRFGLNAATYIGLGLLDIGVDRLRNLKPPRSVTLAA